MCLASSALGWPTPRILRTRTPRAFARAYTSCRCVRARARSCVRSGLLPVDRPFEPLLIMLGCRVGLVLTAGESNVFSFAAILFLIVGSYVGAQFVIRRSQVRDERMHERMHSHADPSQTT